MMKKTILCIVGMVGATIAFAQFQPLGGQPPQRESAEVRATRKTQMLRDTLKLDSEQFNKVYKVYYNEYAAMEQSMPQGGPGGGMPPQGGGMPPQGGGGMPPQGGGGMPPQGFGGGMPPQGGGGMPPQGFGGGMPSAPKELSPAQLQKQQAKRQKKMKKILTAEQYELWFLLDTQTPQHPQHPQHPSQPTQPIESK